MKSDIEYPLPTRGKVVVWGMLGSQPLAGMIWQVFHYLVPLRQLGFDVWYVEDSDRAILDPVTYSWSDDYKTNALLVGKLLSQVGFGDRWIIRRPSSSPEVCFGAKSSAGLDELYRETDAAINLCGGQEYREQFFSIGKRVYLETDPVQKQVGVANGITDYIEELEKYDFLFSYGENLGRNDCLVPITKFVWHPTRPPVAIDLWERSLSTDSNASLSTIANWRHNGKDVVWQGEVWRWSKHYEFLKFLRVPGSSPLPMEIVVGSISVDERVELENAGWRTRETKTLTDCHAYRNYICQSLGEFTVAKEQYVKPRTGWFSDRSVCYLAAGRPVITQDTGFGHFIPTGEGLFAYQTIEEALMAIQKVATDYAHHSAAAREIALEYFDAKKVVGDLMRQIGLM